MKYQVKKPFIDRDSLMQFRAGDTFSCSDAARAKMLQDKGYLEAGPEEAAPDPKPQPKKAAKRTTKKKA